MTLPQFLISGLQSPLLGISGILQWVHACQCIELMFPIVSHWSNAREVVTQPLWGHFKPLSSVADLYGNFLGYWIKLAEVLTPPHTPHRHLATPSPSSVLYSNWKTQRKAPLFSQCSPNQTFVVVVETALSVGYSVSSQQSRDRHHAALGISQKILLWYVVFVIQLSAFSCSFFRMIYLPQGFFWSLMQLRFLTDVSSSSMRYDGIQSTQRHAGQRLKDHWGLSPHNTHQIHNRDCVCLREDLFLICRWFVAMPGFLDWSFK